MRKLLSSSLITLFIVGCGGEVQESIGETVDSIAMDTVPEVIEMPPMTEMLASIADRSGEYYQLPFSVDSFYFDQFEGEDTPLIHLTGEEVIFLSRTFIDNPASSYSEYTINDFLKIDSLIDFGKYEEYVDNLDIGMTKISEAFMCEKILISDSTFIQLWAISYSSYEACPYSSGTVVFGTNIHNNQVTNTAVLGEMSGGGDPPVWGNTYVYSELTLEFIVTNKVDTFGEYDDELEEDIIEETKSDPSTIRFSSEGYKVKK